MITKTIDILKRLNPWHFVWISIVSSELITLVLSVVQGRIWWGGVSRETLIIGAVDAMVVPLIVASLVVYFVKHITELRKLNEQLQDANLKLQELDKMKTDFVSTVSHELRTPLTTIKAFAELYLMKPDMPQERKEKLIGTINVESDRLTRLINDLLDLARIEAGAMKWREEEVSLEDIIQNAITSMGSLFEDKGLRLTRAFDAPLPPVCGDPDRLVQVVTNILSNAIKFTRPGGAVHISARQEPAPGSRLFVEITDTGMGIPPADLELIFEKFQRSGDQLTSEIEGTGLGLAIARQIVDHHGGRLWAASTYGKGSTFTFTLRPSGKGTKAGPLAR